MNRLTWSDDFSIGNKEIDDQHKELIAILDNLNQSIGKKWKSHLIHETILELQHYAVMHFSTEEIYMCDIGHEEIERHMAEHEVFRAKANKLEMIALNESDDKKSDLVKFLQEWLVNHVMTEDKKIPFTP
jgi:hemerythrin